ncbi:MAG TPA: universal stress protein [Thiomonas arsenitoxydans]|uniref:universal stress protein n=1 Tax=Thiomonas TaxID=32012 RepID=UPI00257D06DF|nr:MULTISPECIES: universal stress protein [Thiomonas]HML81908.1 universal stress protein [Thiomonas arsenitoxydans]
MFNHLLLSTDGSELADKALPYTIELAKKFGSKITVCSVIDLYPYIGAIEVMPVGMDQWQDEVRKQANVALQHMSERINAAGLSCDTVVEEDAQAWRGLLSAAEKQGCDTIVIASHGRSGMTSAMLGSQTSRVLSHSKLPVLVVR